MCRSAELSERTRRAAASGHEHASGRQLFRRVEEAWMFFAPARVWLLTAELVEFVYSR